MELNKRFIVDLSQAKTPADIVFEVSNILENPEAANRKIWLKLGDVSLNQSQILSIKSLISSINSTLSLIESECSQTELAAATLGINTKDVEEELQAELSTLEAESPKDAPSEQYIPLVDYKEEDTKESECEQQKNKEIVDENAQQKKEIENNQDAQTTLNTEEQPAESSDTNQEENKKDEEIQNQLDSIFDSEVKLENILADDKDITEMQNWPLTKEAEDDFEIPEEIMTDEDYAILQMNTQYHKQTVRSGQVIQSNGNVVIIGDCHPGCEIHAAGDITVWGVLGGIAHAGCKGNTKAKIRALTLNAIQLRIADSYARRPDHIKNIYVEKSNTFTPEEARFVNGSIVILKVNDR